MHVLHPGDLLPRVVAVLKHRYGCTHCDLCACSNPSRRVGTGSDKHWRQLPHKGSRGIKGSRRAGRGKGVGLLGGGGLSVGCKRLPVPFHYTFTPPFASIPLSLV